MPWTSTFNYVNGYDSRDTPPPPSFTKKACKFVIKKILQKFSWSCQKIRAPSAKGLSQTLYFRFWLRASLVIESFLLKLKIITPCFEHDISHNNLKDNVYGLVSSYKYCKLLTKLESITDFLMGIIARLNISRNCLWWSHFLNVKQDYGCTI